MIRHNAFGIVVASQVNNDWPDDIKVLLLSGR